MSEGSENTFVVYAGRTEDGAVHGGIERKDLYVEPPRAAEQNQIRLQTEVTGSDEDAERELESLLKLLDDPDIRAAVESAKEGDAAE